MKITFYGYNTFLIDSGDKKIAIDPGALFLYWFRLTTLIPKSEWDGITHILVTHGDPDHYWHVDRVADASKATVVCNRTMVEEKNGETNVLAPRNGGLVFNTTLDKLKTIGVNESIEIDGATLTGLKATHGPMKVKIGPFSKTVTPGPDERVGWGSIGYKIQIEEKTVVNLGDTLLHLEEWNSIKRPDVLMIPIGGNEVPNTMNQNEAVAVVKEMQPKVVIPCHYNVPALFNKNYSPADGMKFKNDVEKSGIDCKVMQTGQSIEIR